MTRIAICGACGKMGKVIASIIEGRDDCETVAGIDKFGEKYADFPVYKDINEMTEKPDVIIDFSNPSALDGLLGYCFANNTALILATTGFSDEETARIKKASEQIPLFFSFNMSLGINLLADLARRAVAVLGGQYDIEILEKHHNRKIDAPSGTAIMLANAVNEASDEKYEYVYDRHSRRERRNEKEIGISSVRGGTIVGEHEIIFAGRDEVITLSHSAASKEVFAVGAVNAAVFIHGRGAGLYDMSSLIESK